MTTVYYKGDPQQLPLTLVGPAPDREGWRLVEWPKGKGRGKEDAPWIMWHGQLGAAPWFSPSADA